jgi:hypothetical protein
MTGTRISDMSLASVLAAGDLVPIISGGTNYKFDIGTALGALVAGSFTALSSLSIPVGTNLIQTLEYRAGTKKGGARYIADTAVDATYAAAHPGWAVVTANGRGFRLDEGQTLLFEMFGAYGNWVSGAGGTDDYANWLIAKDYLNTRKLAFINSYNKSVPRLNFGRAAYYFTASLDLTDGIYQLIGYGPNSHDLGSSTQFIFASGISGVLVQSWDTTGVTGTTTNTAKGATGSIIQDIGLLSQGGTVGAEQHGVVVRGTAILNRIYVENFGGNGFKISAAAGGNGNANVWRMYDCTAKFCGRAGLYIDGPDVNAGVNIGFDATRNGTYGIYDSSFLGNQHIGFHLEGNNLVGVAGPDWAVSKPGGTVYRTSNLYVVVKGQEAGASTNAPSGSATSNTWWDWVAAGSADATYTAWVSGTTYLHGGAVLCDETAARSLFNGYAETNQHGGRINGRSLAVGGFQGIAGPTVGGFDGYVMTNALSAQQWLTSGYLSAYWGGIDNVSGEIMKISHTTLLADSFRLKFTGADLTFDYVDATNTSFGITGPLTLQQFGTGAAVPYIFTVPKVVIGTRIHTNGTAAPTTGAHARGEIVWNEAPSVGGIASWMTSAAGTPGTWQPTGIVGAIQAAHQSNTAAATATNATTAAGNPPTQTEFNNLVGKFNQLVTDHAAVLAGQNALLAALQTAKLMA